MAGMKARVQWQPNAAKGRQPTIGRLLQLLLTVAESSDLLPVADIAARAGLPLSTTYRYLERLRQEGLVMMIGPGRYGLGPRVLQLQAGFEQGIGLDDRVRRRLRALAEETGETVALVVAVGARAVCVDSIESPQGLRYSFRRGSQLSLVRGASAKALLPLLPDVLVEQAARLAGFTVEQQARLREEIQRTLATGFVESEGEVDAGVWAIGTPLWKSGLRLPAALSVIAPAIRIDERRKTLLRAILLRHAARWSGAWKEEER
ncbi:MAG: IclR family transcriptional regulator [Thermomicrobium sp.]|nr:IclR family transcriptional regulator [Thermomicrobium sp.]